MTATLFLLAALLWGSSAIVTGHQAGAGPPEVSVFYRMVLVTVLMTGWCLVTRLNLAVPRRDRLWVLLQGVLFFGSAFIPFYYATTYIPSGLAALVLSTSSLVAAAMGWAFLRARIGWMTVAGLTCGIGGLAVIVWPQLADLTGGPDTAIGFLWALVAAGSVGCGTVIAARNQRAGLPIAVVMTWTGLAGALFALGWCLVARSSFAVDATPLYLLGLVYLATIASCVTFFLYFSLVQRVGPGRAAYTLSAVPLVAVILSILFEGLAPDMALAVGAAAIVAGNVLVARTPQSGT